MNIKSLHVIMPAALIMNSLTNTKEIVHWSVEPVRYNHFVTCTSLINLTWGDYLVSGMGIPGYTVEPLLIKRHP